MFNRILLILSVVLLTSCGFLKPEVRTEYVYVEKPKLDIDIPTKPSIDSSVEWKVNEDGRVSTSTEEFKKFLKGLTDLGSYQKELLDVIGAYKDYYEKQQ